MFEIHQRFKGHFFKELHVSFKAIIYKSHKLISTLVVNHDFAQCAMVSKIQVKSILLYHQKSHQSYPGEEYIDHEITLG